MDEPLNDKEPVKPHEPTIGLVMHGIRVIRDNLDQLDKGYWTFKDLRILALELHDEYSIPAQWDNDRLEMFCRQLSGCLRDARHFLDMMSQTVTKNMREWEEKDQSETTDDK